MLMYGVQPLSRLDFSSKHRNKNQKLYKQINEMSKHLFNKQDQQGGKSRDQYIAELTIQAHCSRFWNCLMFFPDMW